MSGSEAPFRLGFHDVLTLAGMQAAEFRKALGDTTEILCGSMYAVADEAGSRRLVGKLAELVTPLGVSLPDTQP